MIELNKKLGKFLKTASLALAFYAVHIPIYAADPASLQNTVPNYDPSKAAENAASQAAPISGPPPNVLNIKDKAAAPQVDASALNIKFRLQKIVLVGNTVFSASELAKLYADQLNSEVSLYDLDLIAQKITDYYRKAGYILTQALVPPQEIKKDGIVKIKIIEGRLDKVSVSGCISDKTCALLNAYAKHIASSVPLKLDALEYYSFLANDVPGTKVRAVLTRSQDVYGAADLTFIVEENKFGGFAAFNNYNTTVLGLQQFIGNAHVNNLLMGSETAINAVMSRDTRSMRYGSFSHRQTLNTRGLGGAVSISNTNTNPDMQNVGIAGLETPGKALIASANLNYSWIRSHARNLFIEAGFKYLNSTTEFGGMTLFKDYVRSVHAGVSYDYWHSANTYNAIDISVARGLNILGAQGNPPSRVGEDLEFTKFNLAASSRYNFSTTRFSTLVALKAQYALNLLPSSETFSYGGVPFGRGYAPVALSGDRGIAAILQLQHPTYALAWLKLRSNAYVFTDGGFVWDINSVPPRFQYGFSAGVGHSVSMLKHVNLDLTVAAPLKPSDIQGVPNFIRFLFNVRAFA